MTSKQCSKCGSDFTCNATGSGCWCEGYQLSPDVLKQLQESFADCLCPSCLQTYQASNAKQRHNGDNTTN